MNHVSVDTMELGTEVRQFFFLRQLEQKITRKGDPYWDVYLSDATGVIKGKVWSDVIPRCESDLQPGQIVGVKGTVQTYQEDLQIAIHYLASTEFINSQGGDISDLDLTLLLPKSPFDSEKMWEDLNRIVEQLIRHNELRHLVSFILEQHGTAFKQAPGAQFYHHAYLGGLLEHTFTLLKSVVAWYECEKVGNMDILVSGAVLHDIGKISEIEGVGIYQKTVGGRLLGHIIQGRDLVREAARSCEFGDQFLLIQLEHIILSHHGALEFGSPVVPQTREAFIIHHLDQLNAKLQMIDEHMHKHKDKSAESFTDFHKVLKRNFFIG